MTAWTTTLIKTLRLPGRGQWTAILVAVAMMVETVSGVTLAWDPSPDASVAGYAIHYGTTSGEYSGRVEVGNVTSATVSNLTEGTTYYFVATAYTPEGVESLPSNEVSYAVPLTIAGTIRTCTGQVVPDVTVVLSGDAAQTTTTASDGTYAFSVAAGGTYTVTPARLDDTPPGAGMSAADNLLIQRQILGLAPLGSPYKLIAADVNGSKSLSAADNLLIQRVILGMATNFTTGLWQFVPSDFTFADPLSPGSFDVARTHSALNASVTDQDFVAIKMGDVNGTWKPPVEASFLQLPGPQMAASGAGTEVAFAAWPQPAVSGQIVTVPIIASGFEEVTSVQFTLGWDPTVLQFVSVTNFGLPGLGAGNFNSTGEGRLAFAWANPTGLGCALEEGAAVFAVQFRVVGNNGTASTLAFTDYPTAREVSVDGALADFAGHEVQLAVTENTPSQVCGITPGPAGTLRIGFLGTAGRTYTIEYCENLAEPVWLPLAQVTADVQGRFDYVDAPPANAASRFYRLADPGQ